jgi:hypothetical protein
MKKDDRYALAHFLIAQARPVRFVYLAHTLGGYPPGAFGGYGPCG